MSRPKAKPFTPPTKQRFGRHGKGIRTPLGKLVVKDQLEHDAKAAELAAQFGWEGDPADRLNGVQVVDAQRYFRRVLHECHIAALNDSSPPTAASVCAHLGLNAGQLAADDLAAVELILSKAVALEKAEHEAA